MLLVIIIAAGEPTVMVQKPTHLHAAPFGIDIYLAIAT